MRASCLERSQTSIRETKNALKRRLYACYKLSVIYYIARVNKCSLDKSTLKNELSHSNTHTHTSIWPISGVESNNLYRVVSSFCCCFCRALVSQNILRITKWCSGRQSTPVVVRGNDFDSCRRYLFQVVVDKTALEVYECNN
jgi:hypothetical protein